MKHESGPKFRPEEVDSPVAAQEKKSELISRFIERRVIGDNPTLTPEEEGEIREYYASLSALERANALYGKVMSYMFDRKAELAKKAEAESEDGGNVEKFEPEPQDPYFTSEVKVLFEDEEVKKLLPSTYGEARIDAKELSASEIVDTLESLSKETEEKRKKYQELEQDIHLGKVDGKKNINTTRSRMERLTANISSLESQARGIEELVGIPAIQENTDAVANAQYERLKEYRGQLDKGFVWLPSRWEIHKKTVSSILNHRWPVLIGESGTGKSQQADAAALELTGEPPTHVPCAPKTGEIELIKDVAIDPESGGSYELYGRLMQAYTGYDNSMQEGPTVKSGRICRLDEAYRIPHDSAGYSILKAARQVKPGDLFYGRPVLPGAGVIWTTNPPGPRYPGRVMPDAAMRRELSEIQVPYPDMTIESPELYDFMLVSLMDDNYHISVAKEELAPAYEKREIPEDDRVVLEDGSVVIAEEKIIESATDSRHGALWRFSLAIKSLQDSFVFGNAETDKYPDTLLRFKEDADGNMEIAVDGGGEPLTLSSSTMTLGDISSWMKGFSERRQKQDKEFHVGTLTEWLNLEAGTYIEHVDKADKEKLRAIFRYYGFLDKSIIPDLSNAKPLTPKEIGYLSPRVPRPLYVERSQKEAPETSEKVTRIEEYRKSEVVLVDGTRVWLSKQEFYTEGDEVVKCGKKLRIKGEDFVFDGVIEDENSEHNGKPAIHPATGEMLYSIVSSDELYNGIFEYEAEELIEDIDEGVSKSTEFYWEANCAGNAENNPENLNSPVS